MRYNIWSNESTFINFSMYKSNKTREGAMFNVTSCMSLFHPRTAKPISAKFCTDLHTNSGKGLNTSMTLPIWPPDFRVPQTPNPKQVTGEKLCFSKNALNFSRAAPGPGWLVTYNDCFLFLSSELERTLKIIWIRLTFFLLDSFFEIPFWRVHRKKHQVLNKSR